MLQGSGLIKLAFGRQEEFQPALFKNHTVDLSLKNVMQFAFALMLNRELPRVH